MPDGAKPGWLPLSWVSSVVKWRLFEHFVSELTTLLTPTQVRRLTEVLRNQDKAYGHLAEPPVAYEVREPPWKS